MSTVAKPEFELTESGDVVMNKKGKATILATFDETTGHLEFVSEKVDRDYRPQIIRAIAEDTEGVETQNKIKSFGIKGREADEPSPKEPPMPRANGLLGDKTPAVVDWYFKWRPQEAYVRYGVLLDKKGEPLTAHCRRVEKRLEENPQTGLVEQVDHVFEEENAMLATRATHRTFLKAEIVGANAGDSEAEE